MLDGGWGVAVTALSRRKLAALVLAAALGLSFAALSSYLLLWGDHRLEVPLRNTVIAALERRGGLRVSLGTLRPAPFGVVALEGLSLREPSGAELLSADRVEIHLSLLSWLRRRGGPANLVSSIELVHPKVELAQAPDGTWNFSRYLGGGNGPAGWSGQIRFRDGEATVRGLDAAKLAGQAGLTRLSLPASLRFFDLEGNVEALPGGVLKASAAGRSNLLPGTAVAARTELRLPAGGTVAVKLSEVDFVRIQRLAGLPRQVGRVSAGRGDLALRLGLSGRRWRLAGAELTLRETSWRPPSLRAPLTGLSGRVALHGDALAIDQLAFDFLSTRWTAQGRVTRLSNPLLDVRLSGENAYLPALAAILPPSAPAVKASGRASLDLTIRGGWRDPLFSGFLKLNQVAVSAPGLPPVSDVNGTVELAGDGVRLNRLTARVAGGGVALSGEIRQWEAPHGRLQLTLQGLPLEEARRLLPGNVRSKAKAWPLAEGRLSAEVELDGALSDPAVKGHASLVGARWNDLPLERVEVAGAYAGGFVKLDQVKVGAAGGQLDLAVAAQLSPTPSYTFSGELRDLDLGRLFAATGTKLPVAAGGRLSAVITGEGRGLAPQDVSARGTASLQDGWLAGERLTSGRLGFSLAGGNLDLEYLNLSSPDGEVNGFARLAADGRLSGSIAGRALRLDAISKYAGGLPLEGSAEVLADLGGTAGEPQLSGTFDLLQPTFRGQAFSDGQGRFTLTRSGLALQDMVVRQGEGSLGLAGTIGYGPDYPLDLRLTVASLPALTAVPLTGVKTDLTGTLDGAFTVQGPAEQAVVAGAAQLKAGKVAGFAYETAEAQFRYAGGVVDFERLSGKAAGLSVTGSGRLSGEELDLTVQADQIDLAQLTFPHKPAGPWQGLGSFQGTVRGPLRAPVVEGQVEGRDLAYRKYALASLAGKIRYEGKRLSLEDVELRHGQGRYLLSGEVEPALSRMDLRLRFDETDLGELSRLVEAKLPVAVSGKATGVVHVWGAFKDPSARLIAETDQARFAGLEVAGDLDFALHNKQVTVNRLRLGETAGDGLLVAQGAVGPAGTDLQVRATRISVGPLAVALGLKADLTGKADADLTLTGTLADPQAELKFNVAEAKVNGTALTEVDGQATYAGGAVRVGSFVLASGERRLEVTGTWPLTAARLAALGLKGEPAEYNLRMAMAQGDLGLLSFVLPGLKLSGPGSVTLSVTGPAGAPQVKGEIVAQGATVSHPALGGEVSRLNGRIELAGEEVLFRNLTGVYGGGQAALSGKITLAGLAPKELNLTLTGRNVHYASPVFDADLDADLTVKGPFADAVIGGTARLNRSTLTLGAPAGRVTVPWNPNLDLAVSTREDMRVVTASRVLDVRAYGSLAIRGRLHAPTFTGEAEASRGTIVYLNTPFQITRGRAVFAAYRGMMPTLDVTSEATLSPAAGQGGLADPARNLKVTLSVTGPVENLSQSLTSDPPLSQADIISALSLPGDISRIVEGDKSTGTFEQKVFQMASQQISNQVFSGLENAVAEALQLDQLTLAQGFQEKNVQLHVGKYLVDNVYLTYTRTLELDPSEALGIEYRVRPGLTFTSSYDNQGKFQLGIESRYRF